MHVVEVVLLNSLGINQSVISQEKRDSGSHGGEYEDDSFIVYTAVYSC
jgi:hypothetical protein